jgi:hypothetical protein
MFTPIFRLIGSGTAALAGALALAAPAAAQGTAPSALSFASAGGSGWTGLYAGISVGNGNVTGSAVPSDDLNGLTYGMFGGYQYDFGTLVVGVELELSGTDWSDDTIGLDIDSMARAKARLGYDAGAFLPFATLGVARVATTGAVEDEDDGWFYGAGVDYSLGNGTILGAEILQHEFADYAGTGIDADATTISARVAFNF